MTKLEDKLIQLGYRFQYDTDGGLLFTKRYNSEKYVYIFNILVSYEANEIIDYELDTLCGFKTKVKIENMKKAFCVFKQELKTLKEVLND